MKKLPINITVDKIKQNISGNYELQAQENYTDNNLYFFINHVNSKNIDKPEIELTLYLTLPTANTNGMQFLYTMPEIKSIIQNGTGGDKNQYTAYTITINTENWKNESEKALAITLSNFSLIETVDGATNFIEQFDAFIEFNDILFQYRYDVLHTGEGKYHDLYKALAISWQHPTYETGKDTVPYKQFAVQDVMPLYKNKNLFNNEFTLLFKNRSGKNLTLSADHTRLIFSLIDENGNKITLSNHINSDQDTWLTSNQDDVFIFSPKSDHDLVMDAEFKIEFSKLVIENTSKGKLTLELKGFEGYYDKIDELNFTVMDVPEPEVFFNLPSLDNISFYNKSKMCHEAIKFNYKTKFLTANYKTPGFNMFLKDISSNKKYEFTVRDYGNGIGIITDVNINELDGKSKYVKIVMEGKGLNNKPATSELVISFADSPTPTISLNYNDEESKNTKFDFLKVLKLKCDYKWIEEKSLSLYSFENGNESEKKLVNFTYKNNHIEIEPQFDLNHIKNNAICLFVEATSYWGDSIKSESIVVNFEFPSGPIITVHEYKTDKSFNIPEGYIDLRWIITNAKSVELIETYKNGDNKRRNIPADSIQTYLDSNKPSLATFVVVPINPLLDKIERNVFNIFPKDYGLNINDYYDSDNNQYRLLLTTNGNLVILKKSDYSIVWETNTGGQNATSAYFQSDGNFVLYRDIKSFVDKIPIWALNKDNHNGSKKLNDAELHSITQLVLSDAGVLQAKNAKGELVWSSKK